MKILVISHPFGPSLGGGSKRAFFTLRELIRYSDIKVYIPLRAILEVFLLSRKNPEILNEVLKKLKYLERKGIEFYSQIFDFFEKEKLSEFFIKRFLTNRKDLFAYSTNLEYFEKKYFEQLNRQGIEKIDLIYTPHELLEVIYPTYLFSIKYNLKSILLFQEAPFFRLPHFLRLFKYRKMNTLISYFNGLKNKIILSKLERNIKKILLVSAAPKVLSGIKLNKPIKILKPANAFDKKLLKFRNFRKEDYLIFFARLVPEKGIYELPLITRKLKEKGYENKIFVFGNFPNKNIERRFFELVYKNNVQNMIEVKGFADDKTLYKYASKAKALIYPSHQDAFPLVVLETLAVGTSVVAYDIPAIVSVYRNLEPVKIVKENCIDAMVEEVIKIINQNDEKYREEHASIENFLELHSSWKRVARAEFNELIS